jgi:hypothetical protein
MEDARDKEEAWRKEYNTNRPDRVLENMTRRNSLYSREERVSFLSPKNRTAEGPSHHEQESIWFNVKSLKDGKFRSAEENNT